jgi:filamentous hemagglutinin
LNNQGGLINAPGTLLLKNLGTVLNQNGEISSAEAFTLSAQTLDNSGGKLLSNQDLTLRIAQALNNVKGTIAAAGLEIEADTLNSSGGTITSRNDLTLTVTGQVNNRDKGLINSGGALVLTAASLDAGNGGEVSAPGDMTLTLDALSLDTGRLIGDAAVSIDLNTGDLSNQGGLITAKGPLTIKRLRDLSNQSGEISSGQSFTLSGRNLNNGGGKIISSNLLTLNAPTLSNQGGLFSGWEGVTVTGGTLDNSSNGTVSSRNSDVNVTLSGSLLNSNAGALVSQKALTVGAGSLDNSNGILSSGAGQVLTITGLLNNSQNGLIDSGAGLDITADTLNNSAGNVTAQKDVTVEARALDNSSGNFSSKGAMTLDLLGELVNTQGKLASGGVMLLRRSTQITNQGGQLVSQGLMTLNTGSLDNSSRGTVAANSSLILNATGKVFNNADGLIYSQNADLQLISSAIDNARGTLQSQSTLNVDVSGDIDNQSGRIIAQAGTLDVTAANLDSRGGVLSSLQSAFTATVTGVLRNGYDLTNNRQGGVIQAHNMNLTALGGFDNNGGRISARTGDALITTGNFDNRSGGLYGKRLMRVIARDFDNSTGGQVAAGQIDLRLSGALNNQTGIVESDSTLAVAATAVDNQNGRLRAVGAAGKTDFQIGSLFNNTNGALDVANSDLTLNAPSFRNSGGRLLHTGGGTFDIATGNIINAGGNIVTQGGMTLTAGNWTNSSVIQAGRLTVNVGTFHQTASGQLLASTSFIGSGGNWTNDGLIASEGGIDIRVSGTYSGNGQTSSAGLLALSAAQISLGSATTITAGTSGRVTSLGSISNFGRLSSIGDLVVSAGSIDNQGSLGSANNLRINTESLSNQNGLIFSGGNMVLRVNDFTNRFADVYSFGDLSVARDDSNGWSSAINNISATMESGRDMTLAAYQINNRKDVFEAVGGLVSGAIGVQCNSCTILRNRAESSHLVWVENYSSTVIQDSASSGMIAGGALTASGRDFINNASTVSAGGDLTLTLNNFTNNGATTGDYTVRRSLGAPSDLSSWRAIMNYNAANDPAYGSLYTPTRSPRAMHFWTADGQESIVGFGSSGGGGETQRYFKFATIWIPYNGPAEYEFPRPHYDLGVGAEAPAAVRNANFSENVIISNSSSSAANAVVQAGGAVRINATQNLTNSVVREGITLGSGASRVGITALSGKAAPTVVLLNAQLPPNLAQQQVNPLALPGFSLPTGQNGLFRLSSQATNATSAVDTPSPSWTLGNAAVSLYQRDHEVPLAPARLTELGTLGQLTGSTRQLGVTDRLSFALDTQASAYDTSAPNSPANGGLLIPTRSSGVAAGPLAVGRVQGLPSSIGKSKPQKYLIETNPVLTQLKQFMSSDYLLSKLGYDPDTSAKRLGDGLYEQRLVQQAVVARTGQAFLNGQTSNEDQFRYLMNNALTSKDQLNLAVGVSLSSQQVAALTHDIVWLEEHEVNGEKVLVPVLYMAQANNRLGPTGALIAGNDISLIAGKNLDNVGTIRATNNLSAVAGNDLVNSGLVEAGNRLDLLAGNDVVNKSGGIIAGRDVSVIAIGGDVINQRSVTTAVSAGGAGKRADYADTAARIEAANDMRISAGRDVSVIGGVLQSGRDTEISGGRDVNLVSAEVANSDRRSNDVTQLSAEIAAGRDLKIDAARDVNAIASQISAQRDIAASANENLTISSAADEYHYLSKSKKLTVQKDSVHQVSTEMEAGRNVTLVAGQNLAFISSRITAANEAYLVAGDNLDILAAQDSDYSLYDKKKKGSWGKKVTKRDEVTDVRNVSSEIKTGGDLLLVSGGDQRYQAAKLNSGKDLIIESGGAVTFEGVKDLRQESHEKSRSDLAWNSAKGKGRTDETLVQSELAAKGELIIRAVGGLTIDVKQVNQQTVSQTIDAMVKADPQLAWLKDAEERGDVDWRQVKEIHDSFKYGHSGLGQGAMLAIIIIVTVLTAGTASAAVGTAAGATAGSGTAMAAATTATAATATSAATVATAAGVGNVIATAALTSMASTAAVSVINNKGNLGAAVKETFSAGSLQGAMVSGLTAGFINYASSSWFTAASGTSVIPSLMDPAALARFGAIQLAGGAVNGALSEATGRGTFKDSMLGSVFSVLQATAFYGAGDLAKHFKLPEGEAGKIAVHAVVGGLLSEVMGSDFRTGALAAGANEALVDYLDKSEFLKGSDANEHDRMVNAASRLVGLFTAAATGGNVAVAAEIAGNAQAYNRKLHVFEQERLRKEALRLEQEGPNKSGMSWEMLLNVQAGAEVDAAEFAKFEAIRRTMSAGNPENLHLKADLDKVEAVVTRLQGEKIQLSWADGTPIVANGSKVYAFSASAEQFADSSLFNPNINTYTSSGDGASAIPTEWIKQFGPTVAYQNQNQIGSLCTTNLATHDWYQQLSTEIGGGIVPVTPELDLALALRGGNVGAKAMLAILAERRAAKLAAGEAEGILSSVGAKGAGTLANAERGTLTEANFAQNKIKSDRSFSEDGQKVYSELAGTPIKTVDDLSGALRAGTIKPNQLPVDYVDMNGTRLILNTRTSTALEQAAIPRSEWFGRNQTGVEAYPGKTFNDLAADQLKNNKLPPTGAEQLKSVRP